MRGQESISYITVSDVSDSRNSFKRVKHEAISLVSCQLPAQNKCCTTGVLLTT